MASRGYSGFNFLTKQNKGYWGRPAAKSKSRRWDICPRSW